MPIFNNNNEMKEKKQSLLFSFFIFILNKIWKKFILFLALV